MNIMLGRIYRKWKQTTEIRKYWKNQWNLKDSCSCKRNETEHGIYGFCCRMWGSGENRMSLCWKIRMDTPGSNQVGWVMCLKEWDWPAFSDVLPAEPECIHWWWLLLQEHLGTLLFMWGVCNLLLFSFSFFPSFHSILVVLHNAYPRQGIHRELLFFCY